VDIGQARCVRIPMVSAGVRWIDVRLRLGVGGRIIRCLAYLAFERVGIGDGLQKDGVC
jgi:hypothetical protein